ncbi:MAG: amidohydrolase family protein [Gammaproteobacteria bacterium]
MIFDSHLHIIDPRFPLTPNHGFIPDAYTCADYSAQARAMGIVGGSIVSGSFQAYDQTYLKAALHELGDAFVGVTQLPATATDEEILALDEIGVRALRFNIRRGKPISIDELPALAHRIYGLAKWHIEVYVDGADLPGLLRTFIGLPCVVIDHMGLSADGLYTLYKLVEHGVMVKASGFGRLNFDPAPVLREIAAINPGALMFGSDLPSTRAQRPFQARDLQRIRESLEPELARRALYDNAVALYRPRLQAA